MILANARLLTMDGPEIDRGWVEIEGDSIARIGAGDPPGPFEDMGGDLLMPGMINPHGHLPMTLFRGLAEEVDDRLFRYILPLERACVTEEVVRIGTRLALLESIRGGVTTVADMYYFEDAIAEELAASGLRGVVGQTVATFPVPDAPDIDAAFAQADALAARWTGHPTVTPGIAPHAPYSTGPEILSRVAAWSEAHPGLPVQIHLAETADEIAWAAREHDRSTVEIVAEAGLLRPGLIAAHCVYLTEADRALLAQSGAGVAHCPRANGKGGRPTAPIADLAARGVPLGLATDGAMSGNTLDLFSQMAPATIAQKVAQGTRAALPPSQVLEMATTGGARVLGMADRIGRLAPGFRADLIRVSLDDPRQQPVYDLAATLVFSTLPSDVRSTMVGGRWLMIDRAVQSLDPAAILADARQTARTFGARIAEIDRSAP
ncbi:amidohydrolase family protein [Jannaschia seohaensis]|uniref:5-methylthioadenosine/S-adenosylhomocysteine deaminase n=1 Tax=Jannaschia seohaensis TaxID=475081 RepID=A0A2Y9A741_9RHOB|nr:amidohydrolase [Jannaschia seohaensis]PWJ22131.1 5-methylthioadenosine/S-adenosylhomocysteine deaminase [Jannaschia seohaensis]SSA38409.1 5-methylthioadenosine/S-adenosylhomocysteine deaminase [Jannaschia seohaensis]